jgi:hypothetical protein
LILEKQRQFQGLADLHFREGRGLAAVRGNVQDRGFAFEFPLAEKEQTTMHREPSATTLEQRVFLGAPERLILCRLAHSINPQHSVSLVSTH